MSEVTVTKRDAGGQVVVQYIGGLLEQDNDTLRLEALFELDTRDLGYVTLKRGDRFVETYYRDRWYNVLAVYDRDNKRLKGWYCNIGRPAKIEPDRVSYEDLALDVWVTPDGVANIHDVAEYEQLALSTAEDGQVQQAVARLMDEARLGSLPR